MEVLRDEEIIARELNQPEPTSLYLRKWGFEIYVNIWVIQLNEFGSPYEKTK